MALGKSIDLETRRQKLIEYFAKIGVTQAQILTYCEVKSVDQLDSSMIFELRGLANAIKEGTTSVEETFVKPAEEKRKAEEAMKKAEEAKKKAEASVGKQQKNPEELFK